MTTFAKTTLVAGVLFLGFLGLAVLPGCHDDHQMAAAPQPALAAQDQAATCDKCKTANCDQCRTVSVLRSSINSKGMVTYRHVPRMVCSHPEVATAGS